MAMDGRVRFFALLGFLPLLASCHSESPSPFPQWAALPVAYVPNPQSTASFDLYALAALDAEQAGATYVSRVFFTPKQRENVRAATAKAVGMIARGAQQPCEFKFTPHRPFQASAFQRGWGLIGRSLAWTIEEDCARKNYDGAISTAILATKFGFDLTGGGATDASLGLMIADDARKALAPSLGALSAAQLDHLSTGLRAALAKKPLITQSFAHEQENMMLAVQAVQDAYRDKNYEAFKQGMGSDGKDALEFLAQMEAKDGKDRSDYFAGFAAEAKAESDWETEQASLPASMRDPESGPGAKGVQPWRRFAKHFFRAGRPLLAINDATLARTRLLVITATLEGKLKSSGALPADLTAFSADIATDPYSGQPFLYRTTGKRYRVYSVGPNFQDDGGLTGDTFNDPDLTLEVRGI